MSHTAREGRSGQAALADIGLRAILAATIAPRISVGLQHDRELGDIVGYRSWGACVRWSSLLDSKISCGAFRAKARYAEYEYGRLYCTSYPDTWLEYRANGSISGICAKTGHVSSCRGYNDLRAVYDRVLCTSSATTRVLLFRGGCGLSASRTATHERIAVAGAHSCREPSPDRTQQHKYGKISTIYPAGLAQFFRHTLGGYGGISVYFVLIGSPPCFSIPPEGGRATSIGGLGGGGAFAIIFLIESITSMRMEGYGEFRKGSPAHGEITHA